MCQGFEGSIKPKHEKKMIQIKKKKQNNKQARLCLEPVENASRSACLYLNKECLIHNILLSGLLS